VNSDDLMRSLGRPNREQVVTTRPDQLTTLQALDLANGQTLTTALATGAANVLKAQPKATPAQLAEGVFLRALSRKPNANELAAARELLDDTPTADSLADLLWAVIMLPEFQLIR
jgi:leucyl-tRNA synthetase